MNDTQRNPNWSTQDASDRLHANRQRFLAASAQHLRQPAEPIRCICGARPQPDGTIPCDH